MRVLQHVNRLPKGRVQDLAAPERERVLQKRFGKRIQEMRLQRGLSQEELCSRAGLNRTYLSDLERGQGNATLAVLSKLASALGIKLSQLVNGIDDFDTNDVTVLLAAGSTQQEKLAKTLSDYSVLACSSLKEAQQKLEASSIDIVVCDLSFGDDLFDLLHFVRSSSRSASVPVLCVGQLPKQHSKLFQDALESAVGAYGGTVLLTNGAASKVADTANLRRQMDHLLSSKNTD